MFDAVVVGVTADPTLAAIKEARRHWGIWRKADYRGMADASRYTLTEAQRAALDSVSEDRHPEPLNLWYAADDALLAAARYATDLLREMAATTPRGAMAKLAFLAELSSEFDFEAVMPIIVWWDKSRQAETPA